MILATKKKVETKETAEVHAFTKAQLTSAKKYRHMKDIVNVVLKDDQTYTFEQVDDLIEKFKKEKVN